MRSVRIHFRQESEVLYCVQLLVQIEVMEGILTKTLAAEGVKVDQPVIPQSLKVLENEVSNSDAYPVEVAHANLEYWIQHLTRLFRSLSYI